MRSHFAEAVRHRQPVDIKLRSRRVGRVGRLAQSAQQFERSGIVQRVRAVQVAPELRATLREMCGRLVSHDGLRGKLIERAAGKALSSLDPKGASTYAANAQALDDQLARLDSE
jgi:hypothetical protein